MSLPAVRDRIPRGAGFLENYHVSPLSILGQCLILRPLAGHFTLKSFTWPRCKLIPGRKEMTMCTISSLRRNGCRLPVGLK